jgi:hypothetical protein
MQSVITVPVAYEQMAFETSPLPSIIVGQTVRIFDLRFSKLTEGKLASVYI